MKVLEGAITLYKLTYFAHPRCIDNCAKWKEMPEVVVNYFVCYFALEIFLLKLLKGCLILLLKKWVLLCCKIYILKCLCNYSSPASNDLSDVSDCNNWSDSIWCTVFVYQNISALCISSNRLVTMNLFMKIHFYSDCFRLAISIKEAIWSPPCWEKQAI